MTPPGYKFVHVPRPDNKRFSDKGSGGGVGILHKEGMKVSLQPVKSFTSFEYMHVKVTHGSSMFRIILVYRPPPSTKNKYTFTMFMDDFPNLLEDVIILPGKLILTGDFNIHMDDVDDSETKRFSELLDSFDLCQHINVPTFPAGKKEENWSNEKKRRILDLLITKSHETPLTDVQVYEADIADHKCISFDLTTVKPKYLRREISYRKLKELNMDDFRSDLAIALGEFDPNCGTVSEAVDRYNIILENTLDKDAPLKKRTVIIRPQPAWYSEDISEVRKEKRKAEKTWRRTGLTIHRDIYKEHNAKLVHMIAKAKQDYYKARLEKSSGDQRVLFKCVDDLLNRSKSSTLPDHSSKEQLANDMADFFNEKVAKIRQSLDEIQSGKYTTETNESKTFLKVLKPTTEKEVREIIMKSSPTTCALDPIPTHLVKECIDTLLPTITCMVNRSLKECEVPDSFKIATIIPLLKKDNLDPDIFKHYRPISNLTFLSKILERVVADRLVKNNGSHPNSEILQSSYKKHHSTETALVKIHNDLLLAMDSRKCVLLLLLDLSAAFDTVDHSILLTRLKKRFGITEEAHQWISSYFDNRKQSVLINGVTSKEHVLTCNVPQGSVLGPKFFIDYKSPLGDIIRSFGLQAHFYADDTQIYLVFNPADEAASLDRVNACIDAVRSWLAANFLKLNDEKTDLIFIGSSYYLSKLTTSSISVGECSIEKSAKVRNIGAMFDPKMTMAAQVSTTCKSAWFRLHQIGKIRPYLNSDQTKSVIHAYVTSKLDQNNSLLVGVADTLISKIQKLQNAAAKMIHRAKKQDHVTPLLKELHWLPISQRITFKVLLLAYKALNDEGPLYLKDMLRWYKPKVTTRSATDGKLLVIDKTNLSYGDRAFGVSAPRLWNSLPFSLRDSPSTATFKRNLKTHLFRQAYDC
jgi:hypothetical protein